MAVPETQPAPQGSVADQNAPIAAAAEPRKKLLGRQFYESIGSPKYIIAPMVDRSEFAWRMLTRSFMTPEDQKKVLAYSPMYHARLFREQANDESPYLDGNPSFDRPLFVQFCANDPDDFLEAARHVAPYCDAVDLNLGCPQGIAKRGHYGAFLQEDWDLIYRLINRLHNELSIPVTAKFRIQETKEKTLEYAKMILSAGANIITVHGRRREQKGHNTGLADWSYIRYLRDNLPPETVIFANGNNLNYEDLDRCLEETGADGVMSAEGNLSDPSIFSKPPPTTETTEEAEDGPPKKKQKREKSKRAASPSLGVMQGHLFQLLRPMVSVHTNVRDALARSRPGDMPAFENVLALVEQAIKKGLKEYEQFPERFEKDPNQELTGSKATIAEYGRPWWICQPHIRPLPEEAVELGALTVKKKNDGNEKPKADESSEKATPAAEGSATPSKSDVDATTPATTTTPDNLVSG
ncbi:uncharacterized protein An01g10700 [Aspergillus niger]|uniref:tRNA-dihydrouridine(16/17) synthase [NAD(P)(+)] n=2 Tax=Aspergillus niger TaxID=5061 RepID=A2QA98_ASPNC|nr:uncharacterized protein An01g10700 [Aspergillus niger]CAK37250.1 unnamed protein product [Aspergillus niger]